MNKELIVSVSETEVQLALLEDKQLVELHKDKAGNKVQVGDIYVGKVRKIMQGLNAAFIDVGEDKDGFVHYLDLGTNYNSVMKYMRLAMNGDNSMAALKNFKVEPILEKNGNLSNILKLGQLVLAQVAKEPISTKGPKLTGDISFAGRYLVLTPFVNRISISQKIKGSEERNRLRRLLQSIKPDNFGVIEELPNSMQTFASSCRSGKALPSGSSISRVPRSWCLNSVLHPPFYVMSSPMTSTIYISTTRTSTTRCGSISIPSLPIRPISSTTIRWRPPSSSSLVLPATFVEPLAV